MSWLAPSHYLNQCLNIINRTLGNELKRNFNQNSYIFIQENAFENASAKWRLFRHGLNELKHCLTRSSIHITQFCMYLLIKIFQYMCTNLTLTVDCYLITSNTAAKLQFLFFNLTHCGLVMLNNNTHQVQHGLWYWLVARQHQAIAWTNVGHLLRNCSQ